MRTAQDLMQEHVVSVQSEARLIDVFRLFAEEEIGAAPVVDETDQVVGVVSIRDLVRALDEERDTVAFDSRRYFRELLPFSAPDWDEPGGDSADWESMPEDMQDRLGQLRVSDVMTEGVVSVGPGDSAPEVARTLRKNHLHHVFVVENGVLKGVVSTFDLLQVVEAWEDPGARRS